MTVNPEDRKRQTEERIADKNAVMVIVSVAKPEQDPPS